MAALNRAELSESAQELIKKTLVPILLERLDFWQFQKKTFTWLDSLPDTAPVDEGVFDEYQEEKDTWDQLVNEISAQYGKQEVTLHLLLQELDLRSKSPTPPKGSVPCFTIHASKGLEFDHVYLVGMVEDQLPSWAARKKGDDSREMQEERRNCFVAITRAQETLTMTYSDQVQGWNKSPSRFLFEMGLIEA
ncbi:MAG: 3'-5' exonuclease [Leptospirillia bacterium]